MRQKFEGTNPKYKHLSERERWIEYARLKQEYCERHGYSDAQAYDRFIKRITDELGI